MTLDQLNKKHDKMPKVWMDCSIYALLVGITGFCCCCVVVVVVVVVVVFCVFIHLYPVIMIIGSNSYPIAVNLMLMILWISTKYCTRVTID